MKDMLSNMSLTNFCAIEKLFLKFIYKFRNKSTIHNHSPPIHFEIIISKIERGLLSYGKNYRKFTV